MDWLQEILPILLLLGVVGIVLWRLPKVDIEHSDAFRRRRRYNWIFLGLTYAFLYFGRYNLAVAKVSLDKEGLMTNETFGTIFGIGAVVYGLSFIINGPLCDRLGGRMTLIFATIGSSIMNLLMGGILFWWKEQVDLTLAFTILYAGNMYFQSFGAVSIVKVNSAWFHVRERGVLGGIFGILISLGLYFAYDWNGMILRQFGVVYVFWIPAVVLAACLLAVLFIVRDSPLKAGLKDFDPGDASSGDTGPRLSVGAVFMKMLRNPVILTIAAIEFCSGFCRNAIMQWGPTFAARVAIHSEEFVFENWGLVSCCAGILAGMFAGILSDYFFNSRRGPVSAILYGGMLGGCIVLFFVLDNMFFGYTLVFMTLCVIGVHGMLSGTASMDFGGRKNAGVATGLIDACVYMGTGVQAFVLGRVLPSMEDSGDPANWISWPMAMLPFIVIGLILSIRIWNATANKKSKPVAAAG